MKDKYKDKYEKMTIAPVKKLIVSLAIPTILTMLVSAVYNMADSFFVGRIDTTSVASIGIVFSIMTLLQAVGFFLGNGSGILISTMLGKKDKESAQIYSSVAFYTALMCGILLAVFGLFFSRQLSRLLGATETTINSASGYLKFILLGSPFILGSFVLNNQLRYQGSAIYSMIGIVSGSLLNIVIDPIFIFKLNLGVKGAAIATVISQIIGFIILLTGTFRGENIRMYPKYFKPAPEVYKNIFKNGLPSLSRQGIQTIANICLNFACAPFGDAVIAGMSVFNRVMFFGQAVVIGVGQGFQPVCSFNNGANKHKRVYDGYKFICILTTCIMIAYAVFAFIFAPQLIAVFRDDTDVITIGAKALRFECIAMAVLGYCTCSNMLMQSLKISVKATILALARQGIFYIPLILLLPKAIGQFGIILAMPISELCTFVLTVFLIKATIKDLKNKAF